MLFPTDGVEFLRSLSENNSKEWFHANKAHYETYIKDPAKNLAAAVSDGLEMELGGPVEHKIFRINRDLRFSKDKTPYNTHVRFSFWQNANEKPMNTPAFHVSIEPFGLIVGMGCMLMPPTMLSRFRTALKTPSHADEFAMLLTPLTSKGAALNEPELKRVPEGIEPDHPHAEHMRRKGLACWHPAQKADTAITAPQILAAAEGFIPLYSWLKKLENPCKN